MAISLLVDGTNYVTTYWHGTKGEGQQACDALVALINGFRRKHNLARCCVCFDSGKPSFRRELWPGWKAGRKEKDPDLVEQLARSQMVVEPYAEVFSAQGLEADDMVCSLSRECTEDGMQVVIVSADHDLRQCLVEGQVTILKRATRDFGEWHYEYTTAKELLPLLPSQWVDYQALTGGDGWPGADGVGKKTAEGLLVTFGDLEAVIMAVRSGRVKVNKRQRESILGLDVDLARKVVGLREDCFQGA